MARPTARVLALLEILQAGGTRTVAYLAARLEVDERTVRRYVEHLVALDVPVRSVRGRYGGYRLGPGYRMPPLMLTDDEAAAVLLGLVAARRAGWVALPGVALEGAAAKVRRVLPEALGRRLDALLETARITAAPVPSGSTRSGRATSNADTDLLLLLSGAVRERRPVALRYISRDGRDDERTVLPYGVVAHSGRWYLTGADSASGEVRTFRLDHIADAAVRSGSFAVPDGFDPVEQVLAGLALTPWRHDVSVRVDGTPAHVGSRLPAGLATMTELPGGGVRVRLRAERLDWVPAVLAGLERPFVVERPDELRDAVLALARRLAGAAGQPVRIGVEGRRRHHLGEQVPFV